MAVAVPRTSVGGRGTSAFDAPELSEALTAGNVSSRMKRLSLILTASLMSLVAVACGSSGENGLVGYAITPVPQVGQFVVDDAATSRTGVALKADPGELLIVFLGFTNCSDACPRAMANVRTALGKLGSDAATVGVAMLTVDPERDTPDVLTSYVRQFVPEAHALRTDDPTKLKQIALAFGAGFDVNHDHETSQVGHTDYTYLVDDTGAVIITWTADMTPKNIASDLHVILAARSK